MKLKKRRRVCQETNNNELSQGNSDAHGNDNENCRTNNDDQSGAMVLAAFRCNVSNISETTHVPVSSPQQQRFNSTVEEPSDNQTVDERVTYDNATQRRVATDEAPDVGNKDKEQLEETTDEQIVQQPQRAGTNVYENDFANVNRIPSYAIFMERFNSLEEDNRTL